MKSKANRSFFLLAVCFIGQAVSGCSKLGGLLPEVDAAQARVMAVTTQIEQAKKELEELSSSYRDVQAKNAGHPLGRASLDRIDHEIAEIGAKESAAKLALEGLENDRQAYLKILTAH